MPALVLTPLLVVAVGICFLGPPRAALPVLTATWFLVPGAARVPGAVEGHLYLHRVIVVAVLAGLLRGILLGRLSGRVFAVRGVHAAFGAYLLVALVGGVVLAQPGIPAVLNTNPYLDLVDQALFFITALALFRAVGARAAAVAVAAAVGVSAVLGVAEGLTGWSYSQWFTRDLADPTGLLSLDLATRGPHERIRVAGSFALEYGWVAAMTVPLTIAVAVGARRHARLAWAVPAVLLASMILTWSRSAYAGVAVGVLVLALGIILDRPHRAVPLGAVGLALGAVLIGPLREALDVGVTGGEQDVRFERLPEILGLVADHPVLGLGLGGLLQQHIAVVDISWLNTYATLGVLGVVALAALLVTGSHAAGRFVHTGPSPTRTLAAGAAAAVVVAPIGYASYDLGTLRMSTETVWGLLALALVANEELGVLSVPAVRRGYLVPVPAALFGVVGVAGGLLIAATAPTTHAISATFAVEDPLIAATSPRPQRFTTKVLSQTACSLVEDGAAHADADCLDLDQVAGGVGSFRIAADDAATAHRAYDTVVARLERTFPSGEVAEVQRSSGRPTWATTAPLWLSAAGFALGATIPDRRRRPRPEPLSPRDALTARAAGTP